MMRTGASRVLVWVGAGIVAVGLAACSQQGQPAATPQVQEKTFPLTPATASVKASFLTGELQNMKVTERVEQGTERVVEPPRLRATLKLKNTSRDQAVQLIAGKIEYADAQGKPIPLAQSGQDTTFKFSSYQTERLDPGKDTSQEIDVPFPAAALPDKQLRDIRLEMTYILTPYKQEAVDIPVSLG